MKEYIFILILFSISCSQELVEQPKALAVETFYNTKAECETAVAAIYSPLRSLNVYGARYIAQLECKSDHIRSCRGSWLPVSNFMGLDNTNVSRVSGTWQQFYLCIRNANLVIANVPNGTDLTEVEKNSFIGEARFLRALAYFQLVRNWGGVPLRTEDNLGIIDIVRATEEEVYDLILEDLLYAEVNVPKDQSISGRATMWAVKAVLSDVYFNLELYVEAASKSKEIINSGEFSLLQINSPDDFNKLFGPDIFESSEEIFYIKYSQLSGWEHLRYSHGVNVPYLGIDGYYVYYSDIDQYYYKNWDNDDYRKIYNWYEWESPIGKLILNKKFSDPEELAGRNDYPLYRYTDILLLFAEASARAIGSPTSEAIEALNKVHRRAYGYNPVESSPVDFIIDDYNFNSLMEIIIRERGYETQNEGKRWLDLKRLGNVNHYIELALDKIVEEKSLLWPIPEDEITYNGFIDPSDQNPGY